MEKLNEEKKQDKKRTELQNQPAKGKSGEFSPQHWNIASVLKMVMEDWERRADSNSTNPILFNCENKV